MKKGRVDIISLGCSKNLIDSERLLRRLDAKGYTTVHDPEKAEGEFVVVNTCGFIADAKEESINLILALTESKARREIGELIVMGCLSERYKELLPGEIPEVDRWYGKYNWAEFIETLPDRRKEAVRPENWERELTTPEWSAYLKISEGCDRFCAFCAIPLITGRHTSRPIEEILTETRELTKRGVKEFNIIAQDLSSYGIDLYGEKRLAELIDKMADIEGVEWIRLHYAYPADFPDDILDVMARRDNVCKYLDIALQHGTDKVLTNMRRHIDKAATEELLEKIRERVPDIKIRTTLMVGFPGEGEEEFRELLKFAEQQRFDRMGAFAYSEEEDTYAARHLEDTIPEEVKQQRLDKLMQLQARIAEEKNEEMVGRRIKVLVERREGEVVIGRSQWDSPEVDPEVIVSGSDVEPGEFIDVEITGYMGYDLLGQQV
ncbi:MAG: 30S ribosomal protein S12 methylthiotransferase RimO [Clostridium sp.]|nr:30S ribosomal protein S12 methylthiotransferase RimO [Prevotella sp.]MCM1428732.1 30S ribosomal protein S12 methylthiotransferase RimO [Clostridium sp.]MCM1475107.1 30S ribosomal protein S12 methylthiotransferase RimO [Muribaculaceae bacterium]